MRTMGVWCNGEHLYYIFQRKASNRKQYYKGKYPRHHDPASLLYNIYLPCQRNHNFFHQNPFHYLQFDADKILSTKSMSKSISGCPKMVPQHVFRWFM